MKMRQEQISPVLPEYARKKLHILAEQYKELARLYEDLNDIQDKTQEKEDDHQLLTNVQERMDKMLSDAAAKQGHAFVKQFLDISRTMEVSADGMLHMFVPASYRGRMLKSQLKRYGVLVQEARYIEWKKDRMGISIVMKVQGRRKIMVKDIAAILSVFFHTRLNESRNAPIYVAEYYDTYHFYEEAFFCTTTGIARAVKEKEKISGDSFSFWQEKEGELVCLLSDGCGSGSRAAAESEKVIDLMENLLTAEFNKEYAVEMIDSALSGLPEGRNMSTLDVCDIDLYEGKAEFIKMGAATSYIKRGDTVEAFHNDTLPLGMNLENEPLVQSYYLADGDMIIMVTDGVTDSFREHGEQHKLEQFIAGLKQNNPSQVASDILQAAICYANGNAYDDMTVMTVGIWKKDVLYLK